MFAGNHNSAGVVAHSVLKQHLHPLRFRLQPYRLIDDVNEPFPILGYVASSISKHLSDDTFHIIFSFYILVFDEGPKRRQAGIWFKVLNGLCDRRLVTEVGEHASQDSLDPHVNILLSSWWVLETI